MGEFIFNMGTYAKNYTFPAGTTEQTLVEYTLPINEGILKQVFVDFSTCDRKVHVKIFHRGTQILPRNQDGALRGDDGVLPIEPYELIGSPANLLIKGWNTDTADHDVNLTAVIPDM